MTVATEASSVSYAGTGAQTVFPITFTFSASSEIKVTLTVPPAAAVVQVAGVDYNVVVANVVMVVAPAATATLLLERDVLFVQLVSFSTQQQFDPVVHERALDQSVFRDQELSRRVSALESAGVVGSVVAGNGLFFAGSTLNVGPGSGIVAEADTTAVDWGIAVELENVTKAAEAAGVLAKAARADHKHDVTTAAAAAGSVAIGNAAGEGAATSLARSDHVHPVTAPAAPADVTKAAASAGASANVARADHKHDVTTAVAIDLTDATSAEGAATSLARSDHAHGHGARGGGTLHAVATAAAAGFQSAADKTKLDGLASELSNTVSAQTIDATPKQILLWTPTNETAEYVDLTVVGRKTGAVDAAGYRRGFVVRRFDNTTFLVGAVQTVHADQETNAAWDIAVTISSPQVIVTVTGVAATTIEWDAIARRTVAT